jgi:PPP family 3-phenylpropionic acid transporter
MERLRSLAPLAGVYALYFASTGVTLPFLPGYLGRRGLSATEIGFLLAIQPAIALVAPRVFCALADRTGKHARVLTLMAAGTTVAFSTLLLVDTFLGYAAGLVVYAIFVTSIVPLVDSLSIEAVRRAGASYSHLRLFGSVGFVCTSLGVGLLFETEGRGLLLLPLVFLGGATLLAATVRSDIAAARVAVAFDPALRRALTPLLAASALHWIACAPYHGSLALHVHALGLPNWVVGTSAAVGVIAEIGVMLLYPRLLERFDPRRVLVIAFLASAARWLGMSATTSASGIVALSLLHGFTFGAFYVAAMGFLAREVPAEQRARGQGLYGAITFGGGGLVGFAVSGYGFDWLGGKGLFGIAAGVEIVAAVVAMGIGWRVARG